MNNFYNSNKSNLHPFNALKKKVFLKYYNYLNSKLISDRWEGGSVDGAESLKPSKDTSKKYISQRFGFKF